ncbi:MAG: inorganic phosphate transporter [Bacteroidales bacterium]|nr:inorganic phosphate transporter [Bacteroidales bacterium]
MNPIYTFIVITLIVLAVFDIIVGVANDAVNFLNSALGSKITSRKVILIVASVGILIGTLTSSGMMDVARSGVFYPSQFMFSEVMVLFLGMIIGDIFLLNIFNSLGLPTSTTVSMVFGLLGAALAVSLHRISLSPEIGIASLPQYINTSKAMAIIMAILLSVLLAFIFGIVFMYFSRLIFSFRYKKVFSKFGSLWCGITFTGIIYFVLFKGLKNSGIIPLIVTDYISSHLFLSLLMIWIISSILLFILQKIKVNILKVTILTGTLSLALAFAGNDLVNFIGVSLAGYDSYQIAVKAGSDSIMMTGLMEPAKANLLLLTLAGAIMVATLFFSKKAMRVTQTELSLASQNDEDERFGSSRISRGLVRAAIIMNGWYLKVVPQKMQIAINKQFEPLPAEDRSGASYDLIRATVNLTAASILISIATSLKLPLSTTYVVFMVAMGSSLADRAWGRESAVFRITGVLTVISGWFITAFAALFISFIITSVLIWGGKIAVIILVIFAFIVIISNIFKNKNKKENEVESSREKLLKSENSDEVLENCTKEVYENMNKVLSIYNQTLAALSKENRKVLKNMVQETNTLVEEARIRKYDIVLIVQKLHDNRINSGHFYVQVIDYLSEITKALVHIVRPAYEHIDNNHEGLSDEQIFALKSINDGVEQIFTKINEMLSNGNYDDLETILSMRDSLFYLIAEATKKQLQRITDDEVKTPTKVSVLYLNILNETKTMILHSRNLIKSQSYFLKNIDKKF